MLIVIAIMVGIVVLAGAGMAVYMFVLKKPQQQVQGNQFGAVPDLSAPVNPNMGMGAEAPIAEAPAPTPDFASPAPDAAAPTPDFSPTPDSSAVATQAPMMNDIQGTQSVQPEIVQETQAPIPEPPEAPGLDQAQSASTSDFPTFDNSEQPAAGAPEASPMAAPPDIPPTAPEANPMSGTILDDNQSVSPISQIAGETDTTQDSGISDFTVPPTTDLPTSPEPVSEAPVAPEPMQPAPKVTEAPTSEVPAAAPEAQTTETVVPAPSADVPAAPEAPAEGESDTKEMAI